MEKEIILKIKVDIDKDEFGNLISIKGFEEGKELQNTLFIVGLLEMVKQQEIKRILNKEVRD